MSEGDGYIVRLAETENDRIAAHRLRYDVFVRELGADGPMVDHDACEERDAMDPFFDQLVLVDAARDPAERRHVAGVYRLLPFDRLPQGAQFYSETEFDLGPLRASGRRLLELGRSCVHPDHRGGTAMFHLWNGLADYVIERGIDVMFGAASFHGTDTERLAQPLSYLHHHHLAPPPLRVRARGAGRVSMDVLPVERVERRAALEATPPLIRAYLRLGGFVGEGAYVDRAFNTTDVCLVMDTERMSARHRDWYTRKRTGA